MAIALGDVPDYVKASADSLASQFDITDAGGRATSGHIPDSDHYTGHAVDFMVYSDRAKGNALASYLLFTPNRWQQNSVKYIIWYGRYYDKPAPVPATDTDLSHYGDVYVGPSPHRDHVHVSYQSSQDPSQVTTSIAGDVAGVADTVGSIIGVFTFLADSKNWMRIAWFTLGAALLTVGLFRIDAVKQGVSTVAKGVTNAGN